EWLAEYWSVQDGGPVTLTADDGATVTLQAQVSDLGQPLLMEADALRALLPDAGTSQLWLMLDDADPDTQVGTVDDITDVVAEGDPNAQVTGAVTQRDQLNEVLDVLLLVVTGLLAVAVVIALIGVGNTLALSVVERRQENGLLR